jgi:hypothetical protein
MVRIVSSEDALCHLADSNATLAMKLKVSVTAPHILAAFMFMATVRERQGAAFVLLETMERRVSYECALARLDRSSSEIAGHQSLTSRIIDGLHTIRTSTPPTMTQQVLLGSWHRRRHVDWHGRATGPTIFTMQVITRSFIQMFDSMATSSG